MTLFEASESCARNEIAATIGHFHRQTLMPIQQHPAFHRTRKTLQLRNDYDRKLQTFGLMNRHQLHRVGRFINLSFTLAASDRFELLNVTNEVTNQMRAGAVESLRECEEPMHVG